MKIMFYINNISYGGAERVISNLAKQFNDKGYETIFVTSYKENREYELYDEIKRFILLNRKNYSFFRKNIWCVIRLRKLIKRENPDVLISFMAEPNFRSIVSCWGTKTKTVVSIRNDPDKEYPNLLFRLCAKFLYQFADGVVFQTEDAKKWFPKKIQEKSKIIFNQVDEIFYQNRYEGIRSNIVTTGRLTKQKNQKLLIYAFASIANEITDNLIIYGEGELREELESLIKELKMERRIYLPGSIKNVADKIKAANLFVLTSDYEGMPNSLMEAMALGVPCLSTDCPCGGPKLLFGDRGDERLVRCGNVEELRDKIKTMLLNKPDNCMEIEMAEKFRPNIVYQEWSDYINGLRRSEK